MIISQGRNYIFVHIPKTGGTSLALALEARAMKDDILLGDTPKARNRRHRLKGAQTAGRLGKHATLADIEGLLTRDQIARMFTFTMVRNPWDRLVSYYHWLKDQSFDHPAVTLAKSTTFEEFLTAPQTTTSLRASPAAAYMRDGAGQLHAPHYIRLEHFATDVSPLQDHLGFDLSLPHVNRSDRDADYRAAYTAATRDLVADVCARDIAQFGYSF